MLRAMFALALLACTPGASDPSAVTAWDPAVATDDGPPLDAAAAETALEAILGEVLSLNASTTLALFDDRLALHDDACPYAEVTDDPSTGQLSTFWFAQGCVAASGAEFDGYTFARETHHHRTEDGTDWSGADIKGRIAVVDSDGATFVFGGDAYAQTGRNDIERETTQQAGTRGAITWTGSGFPDASFSRGRIAELDIAATWRETGTGGAPMVVVQGDVSGFDGAIPAVVFDPFVAIGEGYDPACPTEGGGTIHARDAAGRWYDATFDGGLTPEDAVDADACDGCGTWSLLGEELGTICLDPAPLLDWNGAAW
jgi:hypothetical protein